MSFSVEWAGRDGKFLGISSNSEQRNGLRSYDIVLLNYDTTTNFPPRIEKEKSQRKERKEYERFVRLRVRGTLFVTDNGHSLTKTCCIAFLSTFSVPPRVFIQFFIFIFYFSLFPSPFTR